jgi:hypothetical protein
MSGIMAQPPPKVKAPMRKKLQKIEIHDAVFGFVRIAPAGFCPLIIASTRRKSPFLEGFCRRACGSYTR